jgi:hypothetical protein
MLQKLHRNFSVQQDTVAFTFYHKALSATNEMIQDPSRRKSDETLGAIASFMCHFVSVYFVGSGDN